MSNLTHLMHLKRSIESWNRWRCNNPNINPDLSQVYLCATSLGAANLSRACLRQVDLYAADLWGADLSGADVRSANLSGANLSGANLTCANLAEAELLSANLSQADLSDASLHQANLSTANLAEANLTRADLTGANLRGARLTQVNLTGARLAGANLTGIMVTDLDIAWLATLSHVTCDHVYVSSYLSPEAEPNLSPEAELNPLVNRYTTAFRSALHLFYQSFVEMCDGHQPQVHRVIWPTAAMPAGAEIYLQTVERQQDGSLLVRVGTPGLRENPETRLEKPNYHQLISSLGRGDYYRQQLRQKEAQIATVQRQNDELLDLLKAMTRQNVYVQSVSVLENSIMTGVSKYDLRGANIGSFADTVTAGGQQQSVQYNQADHDTVLDLQTLIELEEIFRKLASQAPQVPAHQRPQMVAQVLKQKATANPDFKKRLFQAIESGSAELIRVFTHNPYISIPMAMVKGWVTAA